VAFRRTREEFEVVIVAGEYFAEAPHEVPVGRERPARKGSFELAHELIESLDDAGNAVDRLTHRFRSFIWGW